MLTRMVFDGRARRALSRRGGAIHENHEVRFMVAPLTGRAAKHEDASRGKKFGSHAAPRRCGAYQPFHMKETFQ